MVTEKVVANNKLLWIIGTSEPFVRNKFAAM